jgi:hypothetical protein
MRDFHLSRASPLDSWSLGRPEGREGSFVEASGSMKQNRRAAKGEHG